MCLCTIAYRPVLNCQGKYLVFEVPLELKLIKFFVNEQLLDLFQEPERSRLNSSPHHALKQCLIIFLLTNLSQKDTSLIKNYMCTSVILYFHFIFIKIVERFLSNMLLTFFLAHNTSVFFFNNHFDEKKLILLAHTVITIAIKLSSYLVYKSYRRK